MGDVEELSHAVLTAIADHEGVEPIDITPQLYDVIDVDALDNLFHQSTGEVTFEFAGYQVRINHSGDVDLSPLLTSE